MSVPFKGFDILDNPLVNRGTAFTERERTNLGLHGLLPPHVETIEEQLERAYAAFERKDSDIERHVYLRNLQDTNEVLFYRLIVERLSEMMPIIYTPTVGDACRQFSEIYRRPRGLFVSYPDRHRIEDILRTFGDSDIRAIVVTDGEGVLGLGDQGVGGMGIPIGKLSLYTACGGIHPANNLPVLLDVGTDNAELLDDPLYLGWRHERISEDQYLPFLDAFVEAVKAVWPNVLLQFEDFAVHHATALLDRYRDQLCMFNDDVQGTASVGLATLLAAIRVVGRGQTLRDHTVAVLGGGSAGCGIAANIVAEMVEEGLSEEEARARIYIIDRYGLIEEGMSGMLDFQMAFQHSSKSLEGWVRTGENGSISLMDVVRNARPSILIGTSGQPGLFTREIIEEMGRNCEQPIIFPLSNPTSLMEASARQVLEWTEGRALVATGSPSEPVALGGRTVRIAQCNNTYIFPGVGLGVIAAGARRVSDAMLRAGAKALAAESPALEDSNQPLLPPLGEIRRVTRHVARAVAARAQEEGHAPAMTPERLDQRIDEVFWEPAYES
ncbi:NAD-dependent malic enzyme [Myxococcota bacterium]|nr:NAD-dependent malic enzyme [Myxococcota bacterium]